MSEHWETHPWSYHAEVITRAKDNRPMFWNEGNAPPEDMCARCYEYHPVRNITFHEQVRQLCQPCTYLIADHPSEWPE